ncbi:hypothetical protein NDU88_011077 [Pleurodeles waltl]|uniref:Uncharacterized protein n=1 Tax=Pleurodeles waltl TaxID=8319 RepID=A0AAV7PZU6_PLEWA|nr:hypothetical protein NDU88_011077 [Pleurodeles waltl]
MPASGSRGARNGGVRSSRAGREGSDNKRKARGEEEADQRPETPVKSLPATLQEKHGNLMCVPGPDSGSKGGWVYLNDMERMALVDSGCSQSVIRQNLVLPEQRTPQSQVLIACVHGDQQPYPIATVRLNWIGDDEMITVGVIPDLGEDLILDTDYDDFTSLLEKAGQEQVNNAWWEEAPFGVSEEEARTLRIKISRKQKIEQRREHRNFSDSRDLDPNPPFSHSFYNHWGL